MAQFVPTDAQTAYWSLASEAASQLSIPKGTYRHRLPEGTKTTAGGTGAGRNKRYDAPQDRQVAAVVDYPCFIVWKEMMIRGGTGGDTSGAETWQMKSQGQIAAIDIDDTGVATLIPVQDEDWVVAPDGLTLLKVESPIMAPNASYWSCLLVAMR